MKKDPFWGKKLQSTTIVVIISGILIFLLGMATVALSDVRPIISVSPMSVNLGSVRVGSSSVQRTVTIKNTGNEDLHISLITSSDQSEFAQTNNCSTILSKSSCLVTVTFTPALPFGKKTAIMSISSDDLKKPTINVKLSGQAPPPKISVSPRSFNFGSLSVGSMSPPKIVRIKNTGLSDLKIDPINITDTEFSQTNDCSMVEKGAQCTVTVSFKPVTVGRKSIIMSITSNDPKKPSVNVKLGGICKQTTLNPTNASNAGGAAMQAARLVSPISALGAVRIEEIKPDSVSSKKPPLLSVIEKAISVSRSYKFYRYNDGINAQGTLPQTTIDCDDGGTIDVNATWIGPDNPTSYSQVGNLKGTINFNSCMEGTETFNGLIEIAFQGYLDKPSKLTITTPNFLYMDTDTDNNLTMTNIALAVSNITYYDNQLTGGVIKLSGDISGVIDGKPAFLNCDNLTLSFTSGLIGVTVSISGKLNASCLSDWIKVTTETPLFFPSFADTICPTAGQLTVTSGVDTVRIVVSPDAAISVYFNNSLERTYNDCDDIELRCDNIF